MKPFIERLTQSVPTLDEEQSDIIYRDLLTGAHPKQWVIFSSYVMGMEAATELAVSYTQIFSEVVTSEEITIPSSSPMNIFGADHGDYKFIGLLYANGAVLYAESQAPDEEPLLFVFLDKVLVDIGGVPYVDLATKTIHNIPQQDTTAPDDQDQTMGQGSIVQDS